MLDMKWVREHTDEVAAMLANRNYTFPLDKFVELDSLRRDALLEAEALKEKRNAGAKEVGMKKKAGENADRRAERPEKRLYGTHVGAGKRRYGLVQRLSGALQRRCLQLPVADPGQ